MSTRPPTPDIIGSILSLAGPPAPTLLPLAAIVNDGGTQMRAGMNADTVKEYEDALADADSWPFPPVIVYHDGARYWLADGFHRLNAAHRSGKFQEIPAEIKAGTRRDAVLFAAGANASHGLRRTNEDKQRAVKALLEDDEWSKWSDREIARRCHVTHPFVGDMRKELSGNGFQMPTERIVERNGQTYQQNTANINANRPAPPAMLAVWELETTVRTIYAQVYGGNPEPYATRDMRTSAKMRAGRFWRLCTQSLPANQFRLNDLAQAINNFAAQIEAQADPKFTNKDGSQRDGVVAAEWSLTVLHCPHCASELSRPRYARDAGKGKRVEAECRNCGGAWAWIWSEAAPLTALPSVQLSKPAPKPQRAAPANYTDPEAVEDKPLPGWAADEAEATQPASIAQTVTDVVEVHGAPAPASDPVEVLPVSQRDNYESDEWYTPQEYIDAARQVMGAIDLDPASSEMAQTVVRAGVYLTRFDDGLSQTRWIHQRIWLNPPYSNPGPWIEKLVREHQAGPYCTEAIVLVNNATETSWFQLLLERFPVCLPARRLAFWRHDHANVGARQGQAFFYLGPNAAKFQEVFSQFGPILRRVT